MGLSVLSESAQICAKIEESAESKKYQKEWQEPNGFIRQNNEIGMLFRTFFMWFLLLNDESADWEASCQSSSVVGEPIFSTSRRRTWDGADGDGESRFKHTRVDLNAIGLFNFKIVKLN